jgi:hypothetical protein
MNPKYVIFENGEVIIFSPSINHNIFKNGINVRSAGFFFIKGNGKVKVYGKSHSLDIDNLDDKDAILIEQVLRIGRFE